MTHKWQPTIVSVIAVEEGGRLDCCDKDTAHVWVTAVGWSPRRAFLTGAAPFVAASGKKVAGLAGEHFTSRLDLDDQPGNEDTSHERLEWPELALCPPLPAEWLDGEQGGDQ
ncbi:hypothetical protein OIC43_36855 [Streptomyces sp. NBC_00825]|uniref:hypothetical protein n=1 Tax=unclassified Streptomyces TaxID=2593676 RepID=UPI002ED40030|nr:hypothetical protein OG832_06835 [Streptomyces sp. NBC_00826]WTH94208.1 hypothetical protein OIC43_36855 [Streptomyces sp. NBC_00825]WTI02943.1 hypothetical protein OHA23_36835 [Streptomyces sp. NBC_00822]